MSTTSFTTQDVIDQLGEPSWRAPQRYMLVVLVLLLVWMVVGKVDRVVTAQGKVIPFDKVKVIQHLEGGIIQEILVRENQQVKAGEPLVRLDLATSGINSGEMNARMASLRLTKLRLDAEAKGLSPLWPENMVRAYPALVSTEQSTHRSKQMERDNALMAFDNLVFQSKQRLAESRERLRTQEAGLVLAQKELAISEELVRDKLTSQLDHFQRQNRVAQIQGEIASLKQSIPGAEAAISEAQARRRQEEARFQREAANEASEIERRITSLNEELNRAQDQEDRTIIRAPIDGVVKNLRFQSAGNVVKSGEPIMEVVPLKEQLVIELKLNPADRGYVNLNQEALVKISTYDYLRYGGLEGTVTGIAADTDTGRNEEQFYRVIVSTNRSWLGKEQGDLPITPGMLGEVDIKVDSQTILWSLVKPVLKLKAEALREI